MSEKEEEEDLAKVFSDLEGKLKNLSGEIEELKKTFLLWKTGEQEYIEFMEKCMEGGKTMKECATEWRKKQAGEQKEEELPKAYERPYGTAFIEAVLETLRKAGIKLTKEEEDKLKALAGYGEQYPSPTVAKALAYLERQIGKEFTRRMLNHIIRLLGAKPLGELEGEVYLMPVQKLALKDEATGLTRVVSVLPQREFEGESIEKSVEETLEYYRNLSKGHQKWGEEE